jgi:hypothetical protein
MNYNYLKEHFKKNKKAVIFCKLSIFSVVYLIIFQFCASANTACLYENCSNNNSNLYINETIQAKALNYTAKISIGSGKVEIPMGVSFVNSSMIKTYLHYWIKGIVGVRGNLSLNLSTEENLAYNFTKRANDIPLNLYLNLNGKKDLSAETVDIYFSIPKVIIDSFGPDAKDNMKSYVNHDKGNNVTYSLIRQLNLESPSSYLFRLTMNELSEIWLFYRPPHSEAISESSSGEAEGNLSNQNASSPKKLIPNQLFDIRLNLEKDFLNPEDDLVALTKFENFGSDSPLVSLTYQILDSNGTVIYWEKDFVIVQTERTITKTFSDLNLKRGNYRLKLTTLYNINVVDEFRQDFVVAPLSPKEFIIYILNKRLAETALISLLVLGLFLYFILTRKSRLIKSK